MQSHAPTSRVVVTPSLAWLRWVGGPHAPFCFGSRMAPQLSLFQCQHDLCGTLGPDWLPQFSEMQWIVIFGRFEGCLILFLRLQIDHHRYPERCFLVSHCFVINRLWRRHPQNVSSFARSRPTRPWSSIAEAVSSAQVAHARRRHRYSFEGRQKLVSARHFGVWTWKLTDGQIVAGGTAREGYAWILGACAVGGKGIRRMGWDRKASVVRRRDTHRRLGRADVDRRIACRRASTSHLGRSRGHSCQFRAEAGNRLLHSEVDKRQQGHSSIAGELTSGRRQRGGCGDSSCAWGSLEGHTRGSRRPGQPADVRNK